MTPLKIWCSSCGEHVRYGVMIHYRQKHPEVLLRFPGLDRYAR